MKAAVKKTVQKTKQNQETAAKRALLQELFYDLSQNRVAVYKVNFVRGLFFGLGSVLGGTVIIALIVWVLSMLSGFFPALDDFFRAITNLLNSPVEA